jgi:threonine/homoserine/homoserine lactone efflux protein
MIHHLKHNVFISTAPGMKTRKLLKVYFAGFLISFLGTLPLGTLNITAFQIAINQNITEAFLFSLAAIIVELIVVRITLSQVLKFKINQKWQLYIFPLAITLLVYLAVSNFSLAPQVNIKTSVLPVIGSSVLSGFILSILNPMHIPFWMGWNKVLSTKYILNEQPGMHLSYMIGIGLGSLVGFLPFILAGKFIFHQYSEYHHLITPMLGGVYICLALYLGWQFYKALPINTRKIQ